MWPFRGRVSCSLAASQIFTDTGGASLPNMPSKKLTTVFPRQVAMRLPSGLNDTQVTALPCVRNDQVSLPVLASQNLTVGPSPAVASCLPSGLKATTPKRPVEVCMIDSSLPEAVSQMRTV